MEDDFDTQIQCEEYYEEYFEEDYFLAYDDLDSEVFSDDLSEYDEEE